MKAFSTKQIVINQIFNPSIAEYVKSQISQDIATKAFLHNYWLRITTELEMVKEDGYKRALPQARLEYHQDFWIDLYENFFIPRVTAELKLDEVFFQNSDIKKAFELFCWNEECKLLSNI